MVTFSVTGVRNFRLLSEIRLDDFENPTLNFSSAFPPWLFYSMLLSSYTYTVHCVHVNTCFNPNSLGNKASCWILKDCYCSVTMLRELGLMLLHVFCFGNVVFVLSHSHSISDLFIFLQSHPCCKCAHTMNQDIFREIRYSNHDIFCVIKIW